MNIAKLNKPQLQEISASVLVPASAEALYEAVLDVRSFPEWAPGVRRVEVSSGLGEPGMVSEWEVSALGLRKKVQSVLEEAESPGFLRWSYGGPVRGWGECAIRCLGDGALAEFTTELRAAGSGVEVLASRFPLHNVGALHLKRSLARLSEMVSGESGTVRVEAPGRSRTSLPNLRTA